MYVTQKIVNRIKDCAKARGVTIRDLLTACNVNINALSEFAKGKSLSSLTLARLADYLNVSVDYLLGRSDTPTMTATATTSADNIDTSTADGAALLALYNRLSPVDRAKLLLYADGLAQGSKDNGKDSSV